MVGQKCQLHRRLQYLMYSNDGKITTVNSSLFFASLLRRNRCVGSFLLRLEFHRASLPGDLVRRSDDSFLKLIPWGVTTPWEIRAWMWCDSWRCVYFYGMLISLTFDALNGSLFSLGVQFWPVDTKLQERSRRNFLDIVKMSCNRVKIVSELCIVEEFGKWFIYETKIKIQRNFN